jgi:hypothetical protein
VVISAGGLMTTPQASSGGDLDGEELLDEVGGQLVHAAQPAARWGVGPS